MTSGGVLAADVGDHVAELAAGAEQLALDVDLVVGEDAVDRREHAGHVAVQVDEPVRAGPRGRDRPGRLTLSAVVPSDDVVAQLAGDEPADVLLRLLGRPADVRREDDVGQPAQLGDELVAARLRLDREHVDGRAGDVAGLDVARAAPRGRRRSRARG